MMRESDVTGTIQEMTAGGRYKKIQKTIQISGKFVMFVSWQYGNFRA